ncbi:hypothetical protein D5R81_08120 [Parashewanella spongiae]|uniref:Extradiol ring-cleavage dioxygenase LigAB LigA subunit domain-containing protein n=1 Tax=Parashewanella spongiae TaxID=342950 RepID=A0A3A6UJA7_9GAMM|nr:hypothetical protein [Parashewanella spongiae]MCL1080258.1 hypothetical protein [Parashewanella spongiae]RJY17566.1 hypothetical protein D5R81_08120 [Parashewanella spongiae]
MLTKFLEKLGQDTELLEAYKKDPKGVMQKHGLSDEEVKAVLSGDDQAIKKVTGSVKVQSYILVVIGNDEDAK